MKSKRTVATDITPSVRKAVLKRDLKRCIFCKCETGLTLAHVVPRSQGGLGIEENLVTACGKCHDTMDNTSKRKQYLDYAKKHLSRFYDLEKVKTKYERG